MQTIWLASLLTADNAPKFPGIPLPDPLAKEQLPRSLAQDLRSVPTPPIARPGGLWLKSLADPCKRAFRKLFNRSLYGLSRGWQKNMASSNSRATVPHPDVVV
jgi:hypothetical protein